MAVQKIPATSVNGPEGATRLVFGGYSPTGAYTYNGTLSAGIYALTLKMTSTRSAGFSTTNTNWFKLFTAVGSVNGLVGSNLRSDNIQFSPNDNFYTNNQSGTYYLRLPSTETSLTITNGYSLVSGTTVTTWTSSSGNMDYISYKQRPDITSLVMFDSNTIAIGNRYKGFTKNVPHPLNISFDGGTTWNLSTTGSVYNQQNMVWGRQQPNDSSLNARYFQFTSGGTTQNLHPNAVHMAKGRYIISIDPYGTNREQIISSPDLRGWDQTTLGLTSTQAGSTIGIVGITGGGSDGSPILAYGQFSAQPYVAISGDGVGWASAIYGTTPLQYSTTVTVQAAISARIGGENRYILVSSHGTTPVISFTTNFATVSTRTNPGSITQFCYGTYISADSRMYLIGNTSNINISTDGLTWTSRTSSNGLQSYQRRAFAYSSTPTEKYVMGGDSGNIETSTDGLTWTSRTTALNMSTTIHGIAWGNGRYVVVGRGGQIRHSTDGVTWASVTTFQNTTRNLGGVGYGSEGFFVTVDHMGASFTNPPLALQSTDGITWASLRQYTEDYGLHGITTGGYSMGANREVHISGNQQNWFISQGNTAQSNNVYPIGTDLITTTNPNWNTNPWFSTSPYNYGNGYVGASLYLPLSSSGNNTIIAGIPTSADGTGNLFNAGYNQSSQFAPNLKFRILDTGSVNGDDPVTVNAMAYSYTAKTAVAVGALGRIARTTSSGSNISLTNWTQVTTSTFDNNNIISVTFAEGIWVAGGENGKLATSTDGLTWTSRTTGFGSSSINALSFTGSVFVAAGGGGYLQTSTDGITWTARTANVGSNDIYVITPSTYVTPYTPTKWFIGGQNSAAATSTDGITWTTVTVNQPSPLAVNDIVRTSNAYVAVGGYSSMFSYRGGYFSAFSTNLTNWTIPDINFTTTTNEQVSEGGQQARGFTHVIWKTGDSYIFAVDGGGNSSSRAQQNYQRTRYTTDGTSWNYIDIPVFASSLRRIQLVSNTFVGWTTAYSSGQGELVTSGDGFSWTARTSPFSSGDPYWWATNGTYILVSGVSESGKIYRTTDYVSYTFANFGGGSNSVFAWDSTNSRWILVDSNSRSFYSSDGKTWTQGTNLSGFSNAYKISIDGTTGNAFVFGSSGLYAYGNPISGFTVSQMPSRLETSEYNYNITTSATIIGNKSASALAYGTLVLGTAAVGTPDPIYLSLYATNLNASL